LIKNTSPYALAGRNNKILSHMPEKKERSFDSLEKQLKSEKFTFILTSLSALFCHRGVGHSVGMT
jgi:hypothetical protein